MPARSTLMPAVAVRGVDPPRRVRTAMLASLTSAVVAATLLVAPVPPVVAAVGSTTPVLGEVAAGAAAVSSGRRVEATALRTERQQVFANPDGTFTLEQSVQPVRVRRGSGWVPVDTTLRVAADGTVAPAASVLDMAFSGGGETPLVRMRRSGSELVLRWPGRLPAPVLSDATATYPEVLPGVDLAVRADAEGFSQVLVVKSARAAANPALGRLRLLTSAEGLAVRAASDGSLAATDPAGAVVFQAPPPYMWDSSGSGSRTVPGGRVRPMRVEIGAGELALTPDRELLSGPNTRYPVYLDPSWSGSRTAWTQVWSNLPGTSFYNGANDAEKEARVGYDANDGKLTRSFFRFDVSGVKGKHILSATLQTYEVWSYSCTAREVQVWETSGISSSTTWRNQPSWISRLAAKSFAKGWSSSSCPAGGAEFSVTAHVAKAAKNGWDAITQGLRASSTAESNRDPHSWKRFRNNPSITITYNTVPKLPTNLTTDGSATCTTGSGRLVIGTGTPTLRATVSDADNAVKAHFQWWRVDGTAPVGEWTSASVAGKTPTVVAKQIPSGAFGNGVNARWRVRAEDGTDNSAWSSWCEFRVDTSRPPIPTVTSTAFPDNAEGDAVMGRSSSVTFAANGGTDTASYEYALNGDATALSKKATPSTAGGSVTVTVTPDRFVNWLHVRSVDKAANRSEVATVVFYAAAPPGPLGNWSLDESGDGTVAVDGSGNGRDATLHGGATWGDGVSGGALHLDGTDGYAATSGAVLDTSKSFSVSAWTRLTTSSGNRGVLSQDGTHRSSFYLQYLASSDKFRWSFPVADSVERPAYVTVDSLSTVTQGEWVHLAGVYDKSAGQIRLYVNGVLQGSASYSAAWTGTGPLTIGRALTNDTLVDFWAGDIDDVRVYDRVLLAGELQQVPRLTGHWKLNEISGTTAADSAGTRPATWSASGVARVAGVEGNAVAVNGTTGVLTTGGPAVRTDGSYTVSAWVRPDALGKNGIAVSQLGGKVGGFNLGWSWSDDYHAYLWSVRSSDQDTTGSPLREAVDLFDGPTVGVWTHLTAVYDARAHRLRLYVNGQTVDETYHASAWNAGGALVLGRGQVSNVSFSQWLTGGIDDVRVYSGVLSDQEIFDVYSAIANP
ncbi:LamG-like jellyroll fold domain-containing protein [Plantactinospora sp. B5E13]|uniref:LamG-like jellyroll fold domain-containing protein n=1 Tax=unclassified Plantactinospora TaxID=2631981 RepID=UPI00325CABD4